MPVHSTGGGGYQWGGHGKKYYGKGAKAKAARQGRAAYANGYRGEDSWSDGFYAYLSRALPELSPAQVKSVINILLDYPNGHDEIDLEEYGRDVLDLSGSDLSSFVSRAIKARDESPLDFDESLLQEDCEYEIRERLNLSSSDASAVHQILEQEPALSDEDLVPEIAVYAMSHLGMNSDQATQFASDVLHVRDSVRDDELPPDHLEARISPNFVKCPNCGAETYGSELTSNGCSECDPDYTEQDPDSLIRTQLRDAANSPPHQDESLQTLSSDQPVAIYDPSDPIYNGSHGRFVAYTDAAHEFAAIRINGKPGPHILPVSVLTPESELEARVHGQPRNVEGSGFDVPDNPFKGSGTDLAVYTNSDDEADPRNGQVVRVLSVINPRVLAVAWPDTGYGKALLSDLRPVSEMHVEAQMLLEGDIHCPKCGEPWEKDSLIDVAREKRRAVSDQLAEFSRLGCRTMSGKTFGPNIACNPHTYGANRIDPTPDDLDDLYSATESVDLGRQNARVGLKVRTDANMGDPKSDVGEVTYVDEEGCTVRYDDGQSFDYRFVGQSTDADRPVYVEESHLRSEYKQQFEIGDRVRIHMPDDLDWHARTGRIAGHSPQGKHFVALDDSPDDSVLTVSPEDLRLVHESSSSDDPDLQLARRMFNGDQQPIASSEAGTVFACPYCRKRYVGAGNHSYDNCVGGPGVHSISRSSLESVEPEEIFYGLQDPITEPGLDGSYAGVTFMCPFCKTTYVGPGKHTYEDCPAHSAVYSYRPTLSSESTFHDPSAIGSSGHGEDIAFHFKHEYGDPESKKDVLGIIRNYYGKDADHEKIYRNLARLHGKESGMYER